MVSRTETKVEIRDELFGRRIIPESLAMSHRGLIFGLRVWSVFEYGQIN